MGFALTDLTHEQRAARLRARFMRHVVEMPDGCWRWTGATDPKGYARFNVGNKAKLAHRIGYEILVGAIPEGLTLDHSCHGADSECPGGVKCLHRACVNPTHLEPVTQRENVLRGLQAGMRTAKTQCKHGHPYDEENTYWTQGRGGKLWPHCRTCMRAYGARYRERRRAASVRDSEPVAG